MEFVASTGLVTLVWVFVQFLKDLVNRNWNGVVTIAVGWAAGVGGVALFAQTRFAADLAFGTHALADFNGYEVVLVGLLFTSLASVGYEFKRAFDRADSAASPTLTALKGRDRL